MKRTGLNDVYVAWYSLKRRECTLKDGDILPITAVFDEFNDQIDLDSPAEEVRWFVAGRGNFWISVFTEDFVPATIN